MIIHDSLSDFVLFLYVHMSHADNNYDPMELHAIKDKIKDLFIEGTDIEKKLYLAIREYNSFDKSRLRELFEDTFKHFGLQTPIMRKVFADLHEIIQADGRIDHAETKAMESLTEIIDHCTETKG